MIPKAQGSSARLREEAAGHAARVVAQAEGDAQRFKSVLTEYQKAPAVTRDRLYIDAMQQVYSNVTKVMVDSRSGSNLLYLPLDKLVQMGGGSAQTSAVTGSLSATGAGGAPPVEAAVNNPTPPVGADVRSRDGQRGRDRDGR